MKVRETRLPGVLIVEPTLYSDSRGYFMESWNRERYAVAGLDVSFVQDNLSSSRRGVLRGLHYQHPQPQGKLISVLQGSVFDVAVDIRAESPTFGEWVGVELSSENRWQLYLPEGFAHGYQATSTSALVFYKCTEFYAPQHEVSVRWNDPDIGIEWPIENPILSDKDRYAPSLRDIPAFYPVASARESTF